MRHSTQAHDEIKRYLLVDSAVCSIQQHIKPLICSSTESDSTPGPGTESRVSVPVPGDVISSSRERFKSPASGGTSYAVESFAWADVGKNQRSTPRPLGQWASGQWNLAREPRRRTRDRPPGEGEGEQRCRDRSLTPGHPAPRGTGVAGEWGDLDQGPRAPVTGARITR